MLLMSSVKQMTPNSWEHSQTKCLVIYARDKNHQNRIIKMEYIIYCDESIKIGKYFSDFYEKLTLSFSLAN
jgi:hypothetical protein